MRQTITYDFNDKDAESLLQDFMAEMELNFDDDKQAELTLTIEDGNAWIDGTIGEWFDKQEHVNYYLGEVDGYEDGEATITILPEEERDLEAETIDMLTKVMAAR